MKRGIIGVIILVISAISSISVNSLLVNKADELASFARAACNSKDELQTFEQEWKKQVIYFKLFTDHGYFEHIEKDIEMLKYYSGEKYSIACQNAVTDIDTFKEHISFSFGNLF